MPGWLGQKARYLSPKWVKLEWISTATVAPSLFEIFNFNFGLWWGQRGQTEPRGRAELTDKDRNGRDRQTRLGRQPPKTEARMNARPKLSSAKSSAGIRSVVENFKFKLILSQNREKAAIGTYSSCLKPSTSVVSSSQAAAAVASGYSCFWTLDVASSCSHQAQDKHLSVLLVLVLI